MSYSDSIRQVIYESDVALFMKGTPALVMCGNSDRALRACAVSARLRSTASAIGGAASPTTTSVVARRGAAAAGPARAARSAASRRVRPGLRLRMVPAAATIPAPRADVAELVDAHGSGPCARKGVEVQVLSSA